MDCSHIPAAVRELGITFTGNNEIRKLNRIYRGKDKPTDVLSFSQIEGPSTGPLPRSLGDIVISTPMAAAQASSRELPLGDEILRLLIHGILHLLGYDHEGVSRQKIIEMQRMEDRLHEKYLRTSITFTQPGKMH